MTEDIDEWACSQDLIRSLLSAVLTWHCQSHKPLPATT